MGPLHIHTPGEMKYPKTYCYLIQVHVQVEWDLVLLLFRRKWFLVSLMLLGSSIMLMLVVAGGNDTVFLNVLTNKK